MNCWKTHLKKPSDKTGIAQKRIPRSPPCQMATFIAFKLLANFQNIYFNCATPLKKGGGRKHRLAALLGQVWALGSNCGEAEK